MILFTDFYKHNYLNQTHIIQNNINNSLIRKIIVFVDEQTHNNIQNPKVVQIKINFRDLNSKLEFCNSYATHEICIVTNEMLNQSLIKLIDYDFDDKMLVVSQNTYVFKSKDKLTKKRIYNDKIIDIGSVYSPQVSLQNNLVAKPVTNKLDVIIVSVDYSDYLDITLKNNIQYLTNIHIVTTSKDTECHELCKKYGVDCIITDSFYQNGDKFNKARALNYAISRIDQPSWILTLDADILLYHSLDTTKLDIHTLYSVQREVIKSDDEFEKYLNGQEYKSRLEPTIGFGYYQLFNTSAKCLSDYVFSDSFTDASRYDVEFKKRFKKVENLNQTVIHIGPTNVNWFGRVDRSIEFKSSDASFVIATTYFNPFNDVNVKNNFFKFIKQFESFKKNLFVGFVDYDNVEFDLDVNQIKLKGDIDNLYWAKEKLLNLILDKTNAEYFIWIDCDVIFQDLNWLSDIKTKMINYDFCQLFSEVCYLDKSEKVIDVKQSFISQINKGSKFDSVLFQGLTPGLAWVGNTKILKKIQFFEKMVVGGGDTIFACGILNARSKFVESLSTINDTLYSEILNWCQGVQKMNVGFFQQRVLHLWHGDMKNRKYIDRNKLLSNNAKKNEINQYFEQRSKINNKVVYTCISGNYDKLMDIEKYDDEFDYVCFTDQKIKHNQWIIKPLPAILSDLEQTKKARCVKILPHTFLPRQYDLSVWIDANIQIIGHIRDFVKDKQESSLSISYHPDRICIYEEAVAVINYGKDDSSVVSHQINNYKNLNYPEKHGLVQTGIIVRKHNDSECIDFSRKWWSQVLKGSKRDQLSFNFCLWQSDFQINTFNPNVLVSDYFQLWTHKDKGLQKTKLRKNYGSIKNYINGQEI